MARPHAKILATITDEDLITHSVLKTPGYWYLTYQGTAVGIKTENWLGINAKYPRTGFNNSSHAYRMRDRLNQLFNTTDFEIKEII
jgi:hypothetical protein